MTLYALLVLGCTLFALTGVAGVVWITRRDRRAPAAPPQPARATPPVSVLKPLCGLDDDLEANLTTFFEQTHPHFELLFGVVGEDDPAAAVVRRLRTRYPAVRCRLVVHDGGRALNPKVCNLRGMLEVGAHDVVVISDSNVRVEPDWLTRLVAWLDEPGTELVTNLFIGDGERDLGATLENLHLGGTVASSVAATAVVGTKQVVVGKSMAFRRSVLEQLGGLASVGTVLAEDYVLGRMFAAAGFKIRLCSSVARTTTRRRTVGEFWDRQVRWNLLRSRLEPLWYLAEPLSNPLAVLLMGLILGVAPGWALPWALGLTLLRDGATWLRLRGPRDLLAALPLAPLKDLLMLAVWALAPLRRSVSWRGRTYRISAGTRLYAASPMPPALSLRAE